MILHFFALFKILETEDQKPCRICQECTERLLNAYDFINSVQKAELDIEIYLKREKELYSVEVIRQLDEEGVEIDATDVDIEDIEILEDEFQIEQEPAADEKNEEIIDDIRSVSQSNDTNQYLNIV